MTPDDQRRLAVAVERALAWHGGQVRKATSVPYVSHLFQVAGLVLDHGGTVDQAIAALLHDAVEDTEATVDDVAADFGPAVAAVVADCTDTLPGDTPDQKSPWVERKIRHLDHLAAVGPESALVVACDKLHNLRSLADEARNDGLGAIWPPRFSVTPDRQLWYLTEAVDRLAPSLPERLAADLEDALADLRALVER